MAKKKLTGKEWFLSKTIWIAVIQGVLGIVAAFAEVAPEIKIAGFGLILKTILDILLRFNTKEGLKI